MTPGPCRRGPTEGEAGFTLVEAVLALLLMGLVVTALGTVTAQWLPGWRQGLGRLQSIDRLSLALDRIAADLAGAEFVSADAGPLPFFQGSPRSVAFVRAAVGPGAAPGLDTVELREVQDQAGLVLARLSAPFAPNMAGVQRPGAPVILVRPPYRIVFAYAGDDGVWRGTWSGEKVLPRRVRISVTDAPDATSPLLSTETRIRIDLPATCATAKYPTSCITALRGKGPGPAAPEPQL